MTEPPNQTADRSDRNFAIFVVVLCVVFFFFSIALYDLTHWGQLKARNACEAVPGYIWVDGPDIRKPACVRTEAPS